MEHRHAAIELVLRGRTAGYFEVNGAEVLARRMIRVLYLRAGTFRTGDENTQSDCEENSRQELVSCLPIHVSSLRLTEPYLTRNMLPLSF